MIGLERHSTTIHHGIRYHGPNFKPTVSLGSREANIRPTRRTTEAFGVGATMRDTQAGVPST